MPLEQLMALLLLSGLDVRKIERIPNGYCGDSCAVCQKNPWWNVTADFHYGDGVIQIGWRKRVISIDWSAMPLRTLVTKDDVTKNDSIVHAWGYAKAVEYLGTLDTLLRMDGRDRARAVEIAELTSAGRVQDE